jgi:hypothetical protein
MLPDLIWLMRVRNGPRKRWKWWWKRVGFDLDNFLRMLPKHIFICGHLCLSAVVSQKLVIPGKD